MPRSCLKPVVHFEMRFCENENVIDFDLVTDSKIPIVTPSFQFVLFKISANGSLSEADSLGRWTVRIDGQSGSMDSPGRWTVRVKGWSRDDKGSLF